MNSILFSPVFDARRLGARHPQVAWIGVVAWAICLACATANVLAQQASESPEAGTNPASPDQVARWIEELDDSRFVTRRNATEHLFLAGETAIGPLTKALGVSTPEVALRGTHVLEKLALSRDIATQDRAVEALQQLASSPSKWAAREAAKAIAALGEARQQRALKELETLGAVISLNDRLMLFAPVVGLSVEIGPDWQGTVDDLQRLRWLTDVQEVSFVGKQVTDEWIRSVENLEGVERVLIKHASISNEAVRSIGKLKRVTRIDLMYLPVNDAVIEYLKEMKTVREVRLYGTDVTREAVEQYQAAANQVLVDFKAGAFLGVMCQQPPFPCQVVEVVANSGAALGGIHVRDIIVRYGGNPVANFDDLRKCIGKNKVGDSVLIQVARGGAPVLGILKQRGSLDLGLEAEAAAFGCQVRKLASDGAAIKAGLRANDVITELNGEPVFSVDELAKKFTALAADARVEFGFVRNSRIVSLRVTFGEWTDVMR